MPKTPDGLSEPEFKKHLSRAVVLPVVLVVLFSLSLLWQIFHLLKVTRWVEHADLIIAQAHHTQKLALDMETGLRGYLLTRDGRFLEPYRTGQAEIWPQLDGLGALLKGDPQQRNRAQLATQLAREWSQFAEAILRQVPTAKPARSTAFQIVGKIQMDQLRTVLHDLIHEQETVRKAYSTHDRHLSIAFVLASTVLTALFGVVLSQFSQRQLLRVSSQYQLALAAEREKAIAFEKSQKELRAIQLDLENRVKLRTVELTAANEELEAFCYAVSHDLRAPLRAIDGFSQALEEDYAALLDEQAKKYLRRIRIGAQRMGRLIDDLLNLSRLTRAQLQLRDFNLSDLAEKVASEIQSSQPDRSVRWIIHPGMTDRGDPGLIGVVLENLLNNAWKFTQKKAGPTIEVGQISNGGHRTYFVRDNGVGFQMVYADKLFGAFQRLHGPDEYPGTGIGLATVRRIVHRHGGKIWVQASPDQGATFYFTLGEAIKAQLAA